MNTDSLQEHLLPCMWKQTFGIDCMGCGMQRSFLLLFQGEFSASISMYPALIPVLMLPVLLAAHLFFKLKNGAAIIQWWFIATAGIMLVNWAVRTVWPLFFG